MNNTIYRTLAALAAPLVLVPAISLAEPHAMLEKGQTFALDSKIRGFQIPTVDSTGEIKYYDLTVTLNVNADGTLNPIADVAANPSPSIKTRALVPGTYKSTNGSVTCKVTNITLTDGRIQSFLTCPPTASKFELSVASGKVAAGHPFLSELTAGGIPKRSDVGTQTWGVVTSGDFIVGSCGDIYGLYDANTPIGAKTDGKTLILSAYRNISPYGAFLCSATFIKQP